MFEHHQQTIQKLKDHSMNIHIRKAELDDAVALAHLLRSIGWFRRMKGEPAEATAQIVQRHLEKCLAEDSHTIYIAAKPDSDIVGYVAVHWLPYLFLAGPEGFISELFIHESMRGQGLGSRLLAVVIEEAKSRGCSRLQLINFRTRDSYKRGFYSKAGWEERPEAASFIYYLE